MPWGAVPYLQYRDGGVEHLIGEGGLNGASSSRAMHTNYAECTLSMDYRVQSIPRTGYVRIFRRDSMVVTRF